MAEILVVGRSGQLALALQRLAPPPGFSFRALGRDAIDLAAPETVAETVGAAVRALRPAAVINAAAYTAVDKAEDEEALATRINGEGPAALAAACARLNVPLVHVSTDYVFDGAKDGAYVEADPVAPLNAYGRSKAAGEAGVLASGARAAVLRTSWLVSPDGANFVKTMLRLGVETGAVRVVADQFGRPTAADRLAAVCAEMAARLLDRDDRAAGVFHVSGAGPRVSWADVAEAVFAAAEGYGRAPVEFTRIAAAEFPTKARRPANSMLALDKIEALLGPMEDWREGVARCCAALLS